MCIVGFSDVSSGDGTECLHGKHFPHRDINFFSPFIYSCFLATNDLPSLATMQFIWDYLAKFSVVVKQI